MTLISNLGGASLGSQLAGFEASVLGKIFIGNMACELVTEVHGLNQNILDLIDAIGSLSYANSGGQTGGAYNQTPIFATLKTQLETRALKISLIKE